MPHYLSFLFTLLYYYLPGSLSQLSKCSKFEVVVFDSYGTLLDVDSLLTTTEHVLPTTNATTFVNLWRMKQLDYTWLRTVMKSQKRDSYKNFWVVTQDALKYASEKLEISLTDSEKEELMNGWLQLSLYPDVRDSLQEIKKKYQLAVLSNGSPRMLREVFSFNGLDDLINYSNEISVDEVRVFKPHPRVYALAEKKLGIPKSKILFVSSNDFDVVGAKSYGLSSVWVNRQNGPQDNLGLSADLEFSDLKQFSTFLQNQDRR